MIDAEKKAYPAALLCDVMQVSRSGYYSWRNREKSPRQQEYERLIPVVQEADKISNHTYGARRIAKEVKEFGIACGKTKAKTLMKLANVSAKQKKKFKVTTDSKHNLPVTPNLLNRQFKVDEPDKVYVADLTYVWTQEGWLSGRGYRSFLPAGCRVVTEQPNDQAVGHGCFADGILASEARGGLALPFR